MEVRSEFGRRYIPADAESDLLRLALLYRHGGCWADSTMLCRRPLDDWLPQATEASGCFAFAPEDLAENVPVVSSFLAAEQGHVVVKQWLRRVIDYWLFPVALRPDLGFFWLHRLFGQLIAGSDPYGGVRDNEGDASARRAWNNVPRVTGEYGRPGPHFWVVYNKRLRAPATPEYLDIIQHDEETPMWKLTNREVNLREVEPFLFLLRNPRIYRGGRSSFLLPRLARSLSPAGESACLDVGHQILGQRLEVLGADARDSRMWCHLDRSHRHRSCGRAHQGWELGTGFGLASDHAAAGCGDGWHGAHAQLRHLHARSSMDAGLLLYESIVATVGHGKQNTRCGGRGCYRSQDRWHGRVVESLALGYATLVDLEGD
mmetsp:Transcript_104877/g.338247  ORF Transcript_104877/g.338247 Transcript_104877/m.338247 type:complete len:374 (+) Transcript_104877:212-1333(+)